MRSTASKADAAIEKPARAHLAAREAREARMARGAAMKKHAARLWEKAKQAKIEAVAASMDEARAVAERNAAAKAQKSRSTIDAEAHRANPQVARFDAVTSLLGVLDGRSRDVMILRYGLGSLKPMTLRAIGGLIVNRKTPDRPVSPERVRQTEYRALRLLRQPRHAPLVHELFYLDDKGAQRFHYAIRRWARDESAEPRIASRHVATRQILNAKHRSRIDASPVWMSSESARQILAGELQSQSRDDLVEAIVLNELTRTLARLEGESLEDYRRRSRAVITEIDPARTPEDR